MKGLIDHFITSLDKIEAELRFESINKLNSSQNYLNFEEVSDEILDQKIKEILEPSVFMI